MKKKRKIIPALFIIIAVVLGCCIGYFFYISHDANIRLNNFISTCSAGNTVKMGMFLPNQNTSSVVDNSSNNKFEEKIKKELENSQESSYSKYDNNSRPSLQSVILKCNQYHAKKVWSITDHATATITIMGPNTHKIVEDTLKSLNGADVTQDQLYTRLVIELNRSPKTIKKDVKIPLKRINGIWYIKFDNHEILDGLTDGLLSAYNDSYNQALTNIKNAGSKGAKGNHD